MNKYIDSNIFIYAVVADERTDSKAASSKAILLEIASGNLDAATSCLTWDEFVWIVTKLLGRNVALVEGRKFLDFPNLRFLVVNERTIAKAQALVEKYKVKPRDAIHAACALENEIRNIVSDNPDFDGIKELKRSSVKSSSDGQS